MPEPYERIDQQSCPYCRIAEDSDSVLRRVEYKGHICYADIFYRDKKYIVHDPHEDGCEIYAAEDFKLKNDFLIKHKIIFDDGFGYETDE